MGKNLDAHRQLYIDSGDFPAFWLGFDDALHEDALAARETPLRFAVLGLTWAGEAELAAKVWAQREDFLRPEELLAALEPPKPVAEPSPFPRDPRLRDYLEGRAADEPLRWWDWAGAIVWVVAVISLASLVVVLFH